MCCSLIFFFFFFNDTATTEIYTLSLHDALPIFSKPQRSQWNVRTDRGISCRDLGSHLSRYEVWQTKKRYLILRRSSRAILDRKSTRLNSSHLVISYAVFCLKKKKRQNNPDRQLS